jgi:hypothetical protein
MGLSELRKARKARNGVGSVWERLRRLTAQLGRVPS